VHQSLVMVLPVGGQARVGAVSRTERAPSGEGGALYAGRTGQRSPSRCCVRCSIVQCGRVLTGTAGLRPRRSVYAHLSLYAQLIGAWRWTERRGEGVERLFQFAWEPDGVSCGLVDFSRCSRERALDPGRPAAPCRSACRLLDVSRASQQHLQGLLAAPRPPVFPPALRLYRGSVVALLTVADLPPAAGPGFQKCFLPFLSTFPDLLVHLACRAAPVRTVNAALRLGSAPGCYTALHLVDSTHAILHEFCAADFSRAPSPAAHAATAVAVVVRAP